MLEPRCSDKPTDAIIIRCYATTHKPGVHGSILVQRSNRTVEPDVCYAVRAELFKEGPYPGRMASCVEVGSNTSTVTLRVVGGDEDRSLEYGTIKYGCESHRSRTQE
jgi:hypothetical protein